MNKGLLYGFLGFILGSGAGIGIGILICKNKYEKKADAEIKGIRNSYEKFFAQLNTDEKSEVVTPEKEPSKMNITINKGTIDYSKIYKPGESTEAPSSKPSIDYSKLGSNKEKMKHIYLISPEEYRESPYTAVSLIYYSDKVLADDDNNVIHVPEELIGDEALESFGRYEDDCVYVRDDIKKVDYEIILSDKSFEEILSQANESKYP